MIFYLVRHGATDWNQQSRIQGQLDVPLSPLGRSQAIGLRVYFRDVPLDRVFCSPLSRACETANIILDGRLPIILKPEMRERCFGDWQGLRWDEVYHRNPDLPPLWSMRARHIEPPGGESLNAFMHRIRQGFQELVLKTEPYDKVLVVTHRGVIRALVWSLNGCREQSLEDIFLPNCAAAVLSDADRTLRVEAVRWIDNLHA